jgi:hypothetical protein
MILELLKDENFFIPSLSGFNVQTTEYQINRFVRDIHVILNIWVFAIKCQYHRQQRCG